MNSFRNKRILIISTEQWKHNFVSKHHFAVNLAGTNTVFFLNPPGNENRVTESGYADLLIVDYTPIVRGLNWLPLILRKSFQRREIEKIFRLCKSRFDLIFTFDPYRFQFPQLFEAGISIYFAADWHAARALEMTLAANVDLIVSPSNAILERLRSQRPKFFLNHSVSDYFLDSGAEYKLPGQNEIKVGYVGNLQSRYLDYPLLTRVVAENPGLDFIFAGDNPSPDILKLRGRGHVYFQGALVGEKVPAFLRSCDILLLCYDTEKYRVEASNSHKIMEYLASGRVVVSTRIGEYLNHPELVVSPDSPADLPQLLKKIAMDLKHSNGQTQQEKRINYAREHTYSKQLARVAGWVEQIQTKLRQ